MAKGRSPSLPAIRDWTDLPDINPSATQLARSQRLFESLFVDDPSSSGVDDQSSVVQHFEFLGTDEVLGARREWAVDREDVDRGEERGEVVVTSMRKRIRGCGV